MGLDDLGLPAADDPHDFARAFFAVTRRSDLAPVTRSSPASADVADELGFPMESDAADFARAFEVTWGRE